MNGTNDYLKIILCLTMVLWIKNASAQSPIIAEGAKLEKAGSGYSFTEGPAVDAEGNVYFTDQPNDHIYRWSAEDSKVTLFMEGAKRSNGMYFDKSGSLVSCADLENQLVKIDQDKELEVLLSGYRGQRLNGPNDLWIHPEGQIYITDAFYKRKWWDHDAKEIQEENVYCFFPGNKKVFVAEGGLVRPNGIVGTPNGKTLYIADINDNKIYSFKIDKDMGTLSDKKLFTEAKSDGMTIDNKGNVYVTNTAGVTVFNKKGKQIEQIPTGEKWTANVVFGGKDRDILFITAMDAVYTLKMKVNGVH